MSRVDVAQQSAAAAQALFRAYHREERSLSDDELDRALGLGPPQHDVRSSYDANLEARFVGESVVYLPTPYSICRAFFHATGPAKHDLVLDLGCGVGRLLLYGALTTEARFRGVEIVERRFRQGSQAATRLGLGQVEIIRGNVLDQDLEEVTVFYLFRPFSEATEAEVLTRLCALGRRRVITVGAYRLPPALLDPAVFEERGQGDLRIYRSRLPGSAVGPARRVS